MLKWAMRIVAVGGALLALAVGTTAWMHRTQGRWWFLVTPLVGTQVVISPQYVQVDGSLERESAPGSYFETGSGDWNNYETKQSFEREMPYGDFRKQWHGFGVIRGHNVASSKVPSYTRVMCPTWAVIAVLLLPMGLWAEIGLRQRRRVAAGQCANCGYDLRATPERCPECGSTPSL